MNLPASEHIARPWRVHGVAPGFRLEDVWALDTPGGADDFPRLVELFASLDPGEGSAVVRGLFALRWKLGALFGWDRGEGASRFRPLYETENEAAAEIENATVHGVLHLGWVPVGDGSYRGRLAVLVKPNGRLGAAYMEAIKPFRYAFVYPHMLRRVAEAWRSPA